MSNSKLKSMKKQKKHAKSPKSHPPEWLFPSSDKEPISERQQEPRLQEKIKKPKSQKHHVVGAPVDRPGPPVQLLNLIGDFLVEYGFENTRQQFMAERESRSKADGRKDRIGDKIEKGMPSLGKIYKKWKKEWGGVQLPDVTMSDDNDDTAIKRKKIPKRKQRIEQQRMVANDTSSSSSSESSDSDSDVEMEDAPLVKKPFSKKRRSPSRSSSSDSDADDEKEIYISEATKPIANTLKRKAPSSRGSSKFSSSSSDSQTRKAKKIKIIQESSSSESDSTSDDDKMIESTGMAKAGHSSRASSKSDSDSDSDSSNLVLSSDISSSESENDSSSNREIKETPAAKSDSSATLSVEPKKVSPGQAEPNVLSRTSSNTNLKNKGASNSTYKSSSSTSATDSFLKKTNEPFTRIPKDIKVDKKLASNAYVPYDYAQKAHEDLIITRGKGFKKEKDKKKRGSYKGGYIDIEGKKGIKFDS